MVAQKALEASQGQVGVARGPGLLAVPAAAAAVSRKRRLQKHGAVAGTGTTVC